MPSKSTIAITFNNIVRSGDFVTFRRDNGSTSIKMTETFVNRKRYSSGEISVISLSSSIEQEIGEMTGEEAAAAFRNFFTLDYNQSGIMKNISVQGRTVTIEIDSPWEFTNFLASGATANISLYEPSTFKVDSWDISENPDKPCDTVRLTVNASDTIDRVLINSSGHIQIGSDTLVYNIARMLKIDYFQLYNDDNENIDFTKQLGYFYIRKVLAGNINISIKPNNLKGATVIASVGFPGQLPGSHDLELEYSLDGVNWRSGNTFTGQEEGDYTMHVRDRFGCVVTRDYTVSDRGDASPFFFISKRNSITFSKDEVWDGQLVTKNDDNTLSDSYPTKIAYKEDILIQRKDPISIQFKSNYANHEVILEESCSDNTVIIPPMKMSNNMGRFSSMDCMMYKIKEGYSGIYFMDGNVYNKDGSVDSQYILNGNLPDFAITGQFIDLIIDGTSVGYFEILDVMYDANVNRRVMVIQYNYGLPNPAEAIVESTYNLLEFEVYQFSIDFSMLTGENYRLKVKADDPQFGEVTYYSDNIYLKDIHENTVPISYFDDDNRDIFYSYGIKHFIRLRLSHIEASLDDQAEISQGDSTTVMIESELYDGNKFIFESMTRDMFLKASIALSSRFLFISGIGYVKKDSLEYENISGTNMYDLTASLLKTGHREDYVSSPTMGAPTIHVPDTLAGNTGLIKL